MFGIFKKTNEQKAEKVRRKRDREIDDLESNLRTRKGQASSRLDIEKIERDTETHINASRLHAASDLHDLGVPLIAEDRVGKYDLEQHLSFKDTPLPRELSEEENRELNARLNENSYTLADIGESAGEIQDEAVKCPKCRGTQLSANQRGFGVVKGAALGVAGAVTGGVALGAAGLAAGNIGKHKVDITCLRCGHIWEAGKA